MVYRSLLLFVILFLSVLTAAYACSCPKELSTEEEYKRSDLVIQGRIIGTDTIYSSNTLLHDRKGVKLGKHKYLLYTERLVRVKMMVEKKFKTTAGMPDTIYILTSPESDRCGYPFTPYIYPHLIPERSFEFIVYGESWTEKAIVSSKARKKYKKEIKSTFLPDTFFTSTCTRTRQVNEAELRALATLRQ